MPAELFVASRAAAQASLAADRLTTARPSSGTDARERQMAPEFLRGGGTFALEQMLASVRWLLSFSEAVARLPCTFALALTPNSSTCCRRAIYTSYGCGALAAWCGSTIMAWIPLASRRHYHQTLGTVRV